MNPPLYGQVVQFDSHEDHRMLEQRRWLLEARSLAYEERTRRPGRVRALVGSLAAALGGGQPRRTKSIETGTPSSSKRSRSAFSTQ
jgi:hypothetical protein